MTLTLKIDPAKLWGVDDPEVYRMSELVREALRYYERERSWAETNAYGRARAEALGIREEDVDRLIHEYRREKRAREKHAPK